LDIPIHVDGASGAFIAPFAYPHLKWSFDVPRVVSINTSGHKFGLVYAGLGWVLWRDEKYLHKDLIFELRKGFPYYSQKTTEGVDRLSRQHGILLYIVSSLYCARPSWGVSFRR